MKQYEVVSGCYVPVGGRVRFRPAGQVVTLSDEQAAELAGFIKPVAPSGVLQTATPEPEAVEHPSGGGWSERVDQAEQTEAVVEQPVEQATDEIPGEVSSDFGYPQAGHE